MKVFDDLIEELKEENLIEEPEVDPNQINAESNKAAASFGAAAPTEAIPKAPSVEGNGEPVVQNDFTLFQKDEKSSSEYKNSEVQLPVNENDFYRRRAMEEVSSLQMVERVFLGVEREQSKVLSKHYDDIAVSKALHDFLQVSKNFDSPESAAAEFKLMQETESWYSALAHRDQKILPVHLRRYCETTRPVLSSQALVALARFYRNSPYSESVRSKFDLIVTRLFSREIGSDERELAFEFEELVQHLSELYSDWSSIPLYATDDDSELSIIALKFEDFITEAQTATEFEELVRNDFFNRLRAFKESTGENFYAPLVTATAIKCNILVGNRYVELLTQERKKNNAAKLEDKYNYLLDQTISEATSKTLQLVQLLKEKGSEAPGEVEKAAPREPKGETLRNQVPENKQTEPVKEARAVNQNNQKKQNKQFKESPFKVNKWLLAMTVFTLLATFGLYTWVEYATPQISSKEVQTLELEGYYFKDYLKVGKITNETLIGVASNAWYQISEEKKQETLKNIIAVGKDKGFKTVRILNKEGKTVGYISAQNITQSNSSQNP